MFILAGLACLFGYFTKSKDKNARKSSSVINNYHNCIIINNNTPLPSSNMPKHFINSSIIKSSINKRRRKR